VQNNDITNMMSFVKAYADTRFGWDSVIPRWKGLIASLKEQHRDIGQSSAQS
jgi:hypothetical protein